MVKATAVVYFHKFVKEHGSVVQARVNEELRSVNTILKEGGEMESKSPTTNFPNKKFIFQLERVLINVLNFDMWITHVHPHFFQFVDFLEKNYPKENWDYFKSTGTKYINNLYSTPVCVNFDSVNVAIGCIELATSKQVSEGFKFSVLPTHLVRSFLKENDHEFDLKKIRKLKFQYGRYFGFPQKKGTETNGNQGNRNLNRTIGSKQVQPPPGFKMGGGMEYSTPNPSPPNPSKAWFGGDL